MRFTDPHMGYIYDKLHRGNLGTFGHHLWPLVKLVLTRYGNIGDLTSWFALLPDMCCVGLMVYQDGEFPSMARAKAL